jgi:hypothetical protein
VGRQRDQARGRHDGRGGRNAEAQADQVRTFIARVFPEAVTLVREARAGLQ